MNKLAANITHYGTFLFRAPADSEPITKNHIRNNLVAWIFDPRDAYEYVTLLQVERFIFSSDTNYSIYSEEINPPQEISKEEAKKLYTAINETLAQKQDPPIQKVNK